MSENLIYGADILAYGAVADGVTDCSDAFIKAIENGENLISVPFGNYVLTKSLTFSSNTKIQLHPSATLVFELDTDDAIISVKDASSVIITGGNWVSTGSSEAFFGFEDVSCIKISDCNISGAKGVKLTNCDDVMVKNVSFDIDAECILMRGETQNVTIRNITSGTSVSVIDIDENAKVDFLKASFDETSVFEMGKQQYVLELSVPDGVYVPENNRFVEVEINITEKGRQEVMVPVSVKNPEGKAYELKKEYVLIVITGPKDELLAENVTAELDLSGIEANGEEKSLKVNVTSKKNDVIIENRTVFVNAIVG